MSSNAQTVDDLLTLLAPLNVRARAMFGEYVVYCDEKVVVLICDDRYFLKPTAAVEAAGLTLEPCPPYPGAKDSLLISDRLLADRSGLRSLVQATADTLPVPKPRRKRAAKRKA